MAPAQGTVCFHQQEHTLTFRVEGRGTMLLTLPVRQLAERLIDAGVTMVQFDLRDCTYLDSTFIGTLLSLKKRLARVNGKLVLISPSVSCSRLLEQMGLGEMFPAGAPPLDPETTWTELPAELVDAGSFRQTVAQAHEELASLPGQAGEQFQAVLRCIQQADKNKPSPPSE